MAKYLEKSVEVESGNTPNCWRNDLIQIQVRDAGVTVQMVLLGWKDITAYKAGKAPTGTKTVALENAETLPEYTAIFAAFLAKILEDPAFVGAVLKDIPE